MLDAAKQKLSLKNWTRDQNRNDYGVTLIEAWAYLADIITFYQERSANESFVRTAELDESLIELYDLINYVPIAARSASTFVKFQANEAVPSAQIPKSFKIRTLPIDPKTVPVTFETDEPLLISADLNLMKFSGWKMGFTLEKRSIRLVLDKSYPNMDKGDVLMITDGTQYDIVTITEVTDKNGKTEIKWAEEDALRSEYSFSKVRILKFTQTARPFGHDATPQFLSSVSGTLQTQYVDAFGQKTARKPIADMPIALVDSSQAYVKSLRTNAKGEFRFTEVMPGSYRIKTLMAEELKDTVLPTDENYSIGFVDITLIPGFEPQYNVTLEILSLKSKVQREQDGAELPRPAIISLESIIALTRAILHESLTDDDIKAKVQRSIPNFDKAELFVKAVNEIKSSAPLVRTYPLAKLLHGLFQGIATPDSMKARIQQSIPNLHPAKLELISAYLQKLAPSLRPSLKIEFVQMVQYDIVGSDSLSPTIYLDRMYANLEAGSLVVLKPEHGSAALDVATNLYRIGEVVTEYYSKYGTAKNVSKIVLQGPSFPKPISELGSTFPVRNTIILTNPSLELRPDPQFGSHELWENRNVLEIEGVHTTLRRGSYLAITDNTSSISGKVTNSQFIPLSNYVVRIYRMPEIKEVSRVSPSGIPTEIGKNNESATKKILLKHLKETVTTDDGLFVFDNLLAENYMIVLSLAPERYWELFLKGNNRDRNPSITNEILRICTRLALDRKNRSIATALEISLFLNGYIQEDLMDENARPGAAHKISRLLQAIHSVEDDIREGMQKYRDSILGIGRARNVPEAVDSSSSLIQFSTPEEEDLYETLDLINTKLQELERITIALSQEISGLLLEEFYPSVRQLTDNILLQIEIVSEALKIMKLALGSTLQADRIDCPLGTTQAISLRSDTDITLTMTVDHSQEFSYFISKTESSKAEICQVTAVEFSESKTTVTIEPPLYYSYVKGLAQISGNIVKGSHGETVGPEILGSGDATQKHQKFRLKKGPITFIASRENPDGFQSTLRIFVDGIEWQQRTDFLTSSPTDLHYVLSFGDDGVPIIMFGDGTKGSILPSGVDNVIAYYRVGTGKEGNLEPNTPVIPVENNAAISSASLPVGSFGGYSEPPKNQKNYARAFVSCLERAVTLEDYSNLALCFGDIGKAKAFSFNEEGREMIKLVIASQGGRVPSAALFSDLYKFMNGRRDANIPLVIESFSAIPVDIVIQVDINEKYQKSKVISEIEDRLCPGPNSVAGGSSFFAFERLGFGEPVRLSDVYGIIESIEGIEDVAVKRFCRRDSIKPVQDVIYCEDDKILRCNNDPSNPSAGTLTVIAKGGLEVT